MGDARRGERRETGDGKSGRDAGKGAGRAHQEEWEAIEVIERALGESYSDSLAFARSSYIRWLISDSSRAGQLDRADSHLERWRQENGGRDEGLYGAISLACAESELARHRGRTGDALVSAWTALQRSNHVRAHRFRLLACCMLLASAVAAGDLDCARPFFDEMQHGHSLQIGEQRCDAYRVEAVFRLALARGTEPQSRAAGIDAPETGCVEGHTESEELRLFSRAYRAAHAEARLLDRRFGSRHHVRELA